MIIINETFYSLSKEKQEKILNAAFLEFATNDYKKASTNHIVHNAGISKGLLFFYFNNKHELYNYLISLGINFIQDEYLNKLDYNIKDLIEKSKQMAMLKLIAYKKNPVIYQFMGTVYLTDNFNELNEDLQKILNNIQETKIKNFYNNIDTSLFRKGLSPENVFKMIKWIFDGYERELTEHFKMNSTNIIDYEPYWDEFYSYLDDLKKAFYD